MQVRYDFIGHFVVYTSVIDGSAYQSIHNRSGMNEQDAMRSFHREHAREITVLRKQSKQYESKSIA